MWHASYTNSGGQSTSSAKATVIRHARQAAAAAGAPLVVLRGKPKKGLTKATKAKRLAFAKLANKKKDWRRVLFSDRKRFEFKYPGSKVRSVRWAMRGPQHVEAAAVEVYQPNHPQSVNLYMGIGKCGVTEVHIVAGTSQHTTTYKTKKGVPAKNIPSQEYAAVLEKTLLPGGSKLFTPQGISTWEFMQDNDPSH